MASIRRSVVASVLFVVFGGPFIVLMLVPWLITRFRVPQALPVWHFWLGGLLIAAGMALFLDCVIRFIAVGHGALVPVVPTERLVISGLYRYTRNPMYAGIVTMILGEWLIFWDRGVFIEFVIVCGAFDLFVWFYEEPKLTRTFGNQYLRYRDEIPRWFPKLKRWEG